MASSVWSGEALRSQLRSETVSGPIEDQSCGNALVLTHLDIFDRAGNVGGNDLATRHVEVHAHADRDCRDDSDTDHPIWPDRIALVARASVPINNRTGELSRLGL